MTTPNNSPRKSIGKKLAAVLVASTVLGVGIAGFEAATGSVAQAEAVRVETPAAAPSFADIIEKVSPAVVSVRVKTNIQPASDMQFNFNGQDLDQLPPPLQKFFRDFGPRFGNPDGFDNRRSQRPQRARPVAQGSGFFISEDGYLVTNNHVVDNGTEFTVVMDDGTELNANLIGTDPRTDLALLKVEEARKFTYVAFADDLHRNVGNERSNDAEYSEPGRGERDCASGHNADRQRRFENDVAIRRLEAERADIAFLDDLLDALNELVAGNLDFFGEGLPAFGIIVLRIHPIGPPWLDPCGLRGPDITCIAVRR